ncbi:carboxypeptidase regulatory-like domain-containing protein [Olleya sp. Bg11-27]|uniref:carboxypeptidase regulatory-like domain-containing protein n=1 Tax=Olleya sp. Bg11-27 TaxID=2058135 RepID=UPI000C315052|nr:carboxypeptidase-like regulatory domain-containing protein [Olleya sp. Bg11-27]AUC74446.1 TonB-dependent receptor [Olleya sp. Bg11-27]
MIRPFLFFLFVMLANNALLAQDTLVKGSVNDAITNLPIVGVIVTIEDSSLSTRTDDFGQFRFHENIPLGEQVLRIEHLQYITKRYPIIINEGQTIDIQDMVLTFNVVDNKALYVISISDDQLNSEDDGLTSNVSGLLQSSKDAFLSAAAYDFSATFFRPRGLDNANSKVLINGLEFNKQNTGRPQWGNWGGINDVQRNQEFSMGMASNDYSFGDLAGTNNIIMRASKYRKGGRLSLSSANRSYQGRLMLSYNSGIMKNNWAYSVLASRRFGNGGYVEGTLYDANSFAASIEKQINDKHSINLTSIYAQNRRGKGTALTDEVFNLKGRHYNPFWGTQNGEVRNSRIRNIEEPIIMLNHYWDISEKTEINTNIGYQFGTSGNTRVDNGGTRLVNFQGQDSYIGGARNTDPTYYQNLPSYFLNVDGGPTAYNYEQAYIAQQTFKNDGQFNWNDLYIANTISANQGFNSIYAIQEDRVDDKQLMANVIFDTELSDNIRLNAAVNYRDLKSENFALVSDLLGGTGYLDVDFFSDETTESTDGTLTTAQSDIRNPNRIVTEGGRYKYNYNINASVYSAFAQSVFNYSKVDFYLAGNVSTTNYQRDGLFENGYFTGHSFGKGEKVQFKNFGAKAGATYKVSGRHILDFNGAYFTKAPNIRNTFANVRQSNMLIEDADSQIITSIDASYIFRSTIVKARLTGFYSNFKKGTETGFYYSEGVGNNLVQEAVTGIETQRIGAEFGIEAQVTPTVKFKGAVSVGQYTYNNNPNLTFYSQEFGVGRAVFGNGTTNLKNLHVSGGPEQALQLGFEYRDPGYWNVGVTANHFSNAYVNTSAIKRSAAFVTDPELYSETQFQEGTADGAVYVLTGGEINNIDPDIAKQLLHQEQFDSYMLVNIIGGKSWRMGDYFAGFFATINNVLNQEYKTGGFEQSRRVDYRSQLVEQTNANGPVFGNRYFFGNGTTYYLNVYVRF